MYPKFASVVLAAGLIAAAGGNARAEVYSARLPATPFDQVNRLQISVPIPSGAPVRAALLSGDWSRFGTGSTRVSGETSLRLTADGVTYIDGLAGGTSNGDPYRFPVGSDGSRWFNRPQGGATPIYGELFSAPAAMTYDAEVRLSGTAPATTQGRAVLTNGAVNLFTDAVEPFRGTGLNGGTMAGRPNTSTTVLPGDYQYASYDFTPNVGGVYAVLGDWRNDQSYYDGFLLLYRGGFDPANPLTNLVGFDDNIVNVRGTAGAPTGNIMGSSMFIRMDEGVQYTIVATTSLDADPFVGRHTIYVAGGNVVNVPAPGALGIAGIGFGLISRRRRRA